MGKIKNIFLIFLMNLFITNSIDSAGLKWCEVPKFSNNTNNPMYWDDRFLVREIVNPDPNNWESPLNWNPPILTKNNETLPARKTIKINKKSYIDFKSCEIPDMTNSIGRPEENRIRLRGVGAKSGDLMLTSGNFLELNPMHGVGIAWLKDPILNKKSISFFAQSTDQDQIVFGEEISSDYLFKIVLGQNESKIITHEEEIAEQEITQNNEALITLGDIIYLTNETTGNILYFNPANKTKAIDAKTAKVDIAKIKTDKIYQWQLFPKPTNLDDITFVKDGISCFLYSNGFLNKGAVGEAIVFDKKYFESRFSIVKVDKTKDESIKDGDKVKILSVSQDAWLVDENGIARVRWPHQNKNNIWKISLVNPRKKIDTALRYPKVTRSQNPNAMAQPGLNGLYWISIKDDFILVGSGYQPGQNIILSRKLPEKFLGKINYMGFSSNQHYASYTNILTGNPVDLKKTYKIYKDTKENISSSGDFNWLANFPLRSSHKGSIITNLKADKNAQIAFSSSPDNAGIKYVLEIGGQNNQTISISKKLSTKLEEQYRVYLPQVITKENNLFQISVDDGLFLVTRNKEFLFAWQDPKAPDVKYNVIGFGAPNSSAEFSNIKIAASIKLEYRRTEKEYKQILSDFRQAYMLPFKLISPFEYWLQQVGPVIRIIDPIYNPVGWDVFAMPEAGPHFVRVTIESTGRPRLDKTEDSKGHLAEHIIDIGCDTLGGVGSSVTKVGAAYKKKAQDIKKEARKTPAQAELLLGKAKKFKTTGVAAEAVGQAIDAVSATAIPIIQNIKEQIFKPTTGIYTERPETATASGKTNEAINQSTQLIQQYFDQIDSLEKETAGMMGGGDTEAMIQKNQANFLIKIDLSNRIIDNMISSENVSRETRNRMLRNLDYLFNESKNQPPSAYGPLTGLFTRAYDNRFLLNPENPEFDGLRGELYTKRNMLGRVLFAGLENKVIDEVEIQASHGEPIWFDTTIPNKGSIKFAASGPGNIIIVFHNKTDRIRKMQEATDLILVNIGAFDNTKTVICSDSNMQVENFVTADDEPDAIANEVTFREYGVSYNNGTVTFYIIKNGETKPIIKWQDPYPSKKTTIGVSTWNAPIKIKYIKIGPPIEETEKQKIIKQK